MHFDGVQLGLLAAGKLAQLRPADIAPGLTGAELARVEHQVGFEFADDHRAFLSAGLPIGPQWPDWREAPAETLRYLLDAPISGVIFDVEHGHYWHLYWGERPESTVDAVAVAMTRLAAAPRLVPVYAHRYLPAGRGTAGHPVLSIYQTDVICYGSDLADYVDQEFGNPPGGTSAGFTIPAGTSVPFWSDLLSIA